MDFLLLVFLALGLLCFNSDLFTKASDQTFSSNEKCACCGSGSCSLLNVTCPAGQKCFILRAQYGYHQGTQCPATIIGSSCNSSNYCGTGVGTQTPCYEDYGHNDFDDLYRQCWIGGCDVPRRGIGCPQLQNTVSNFVCLQYVCATDYHIMDFKENLTMESSLIAVRYNSSQDYEEGFWQCVVTVNDPLTTSVRVLIVKEPNDENCGKCSLLGINGSTNFLCNATNVSHQIFEESNNFNITLYRSNVGDFHMGWIIMKARRGNMTVSCGEYLGKTPPFFTGTVSSPQEEECTTVVQPSTSNPTTSTSSTSSGMPGASEQGPEVTSPPEVTTDAAGGSSKTGAVVGGVVAAVVVLVAIVIGVLCFIRRKRQKQEEAKPKTGSYHGRLPLTSLQSSSSSGPSFVQPGTTGIRDHVTPDFPAKRHDYFVVEPEVGANGHAIDASETDYNRLGQKKTQSSSSNPAATYGRLGEVGGGGEDTDYSYDHLARGRQAAPDVIDSDYNTPGLTSEGDYNVAGIPKKQQVITGSPYDTAEIVTSEGDYNRVDFQGKKQHVITGSDYDTAQIVTSEGDYNRVDFRGKKQKVVTGSDYDLATVATQDTA